MAKPRLSKSCAASMLDALGARANYGFLRLYAGAQPRRVEDATKEPMLAELRFDQRAFGPANGFTMEANSIKDDPAARADGVVTWCQILSSDEAPLWDGKSGGPDSCLDLSSQVVSRGQRVSVSKLVINMR